MFSFFLPLTFVVSNLINIGLFGISSGDGVKLSWPLSMIEVKSQSRPLKVFRQLKSEVSIAISFVTPRSQLCLPLEPKFVLAPAVDFISVEYCLVIGVPTTIFYIINFVKYFNYIFYFIHQALFKPSHLSRYNKLRICFQTI